MECVFGYTRPSGGTPWLKRPEVVSHAQLAKRWPRALNAVEDRKSNGILGLHRSVPVTGI